LFLIGCEKLPSLIFAISSLLILHPSIRRAPPVEIPTKKDFLLLLPRGKERKERAEPKKSSSQFKALRALFFLSQKKKQPYTNHYVRLPFFPLHPAE